MKKILNRYPYEVYSYVIYSIGGGYSLLFVVAFSHTVEVTPIEQRQIGICLMEMAIYVAELFILPFGFVIDRYRLLRIYNFELKLGNRIKATA